MKKLFASLVLVLTLLMSSPAEAHYCGSHYYVTYKDFYQEEHNFKNCDRHYLLKDVSIYYYSNGTRRTYISNTIFNKDGSILVSGCSDVNHIESNGKHYFIFYKNKKYQIMDEFGNILSVKKYKYMREIAQDKLLVKLDKRFGIVNLNDEIIVPIKYKKFEQIGKDLFLTKLNGYYGILNSSNKILIKNEHDKISPIHETFLLKKYNKFGLASKSGEIILPIEYDKIKELDEYIVIEKDGLYGLLDSSGNVISKPIYKKIRLNRNNIEVKLPRQNWQTL